MCGNKDFTGCLNYSFQHNEGVGEHGASRASNREEPRGGCRTITVIGSSQVRDVDEIAPMGAALALTWLWSLKKSFVTVRGRMTP